MIKSLFFQIVNFMLHDKHDVLKVNPEQTYKITFGDTPFAADIHLLEFSFEQFSTSYVV